MVLYICGRIFYFAAKFDPLEEGSLELGDGLTRIIQLVGALLMAQMQVTSGVLKTEDSDKYGQHVDSYNELKKKEIWATEARGGHVLHYGSHHGRQL